MNTDENDYKIPTLIEMEQNPNDYLQLVRYKVAKLISQEPKLFKIVKDRRHRISHETLNNKEYWHYTRPKKLNDTLQHVFDIIRADEKLKKAYIDIDNVKKPKKSNINKKGGGISTYVGEFGIMRVEESGNTLTYFNTIKVIKYINSSGSAKETFEEDTNSKWQFRKMLEKAKDGTLSDVDMEKLYSAHFTLGTNGHMKKYEKIKVDIRPSAPNRYGKKHLEADIKEQGGKATPTQETLLIVADLETLKQRLSKRCINDHYLGTSQVSPNDHKKISKLITDFNNDLKNILGVNFSTTGTR